MTILSDRCIEPENVKPKCGSSAYIGAQTDKKKGTKIRITCNTNGKVDIEHSSVVDADTMDATCTLTEASGMIWIATVEIFDGGRIHLI